MTKFSAGNIDNRPIKVTIVYDIHLDANIVQMEVPCGSVPSEIAEKFAHESCFNFARAFLQKCSRFSRLRYKERHR